MAVQQDGEADRTPALVDLLAEHRQQLVRFLEREASGLARFEDAEDLAQGVHLHALGVADRFEYRGEGPFVGWLYAVARRYIADRNAYWKALKRNAGTVLRLTYGAGSAPGGAAFAPPASLVGPVSFAQNRENLAVATQCLAALPDRDRQLVTHVSQGLSIEETAEAMDLGYDAAQRARHRALTRFEKLFRIAAQDPAP